LVVESSDEQQYRVGRGHKRVVYRHKKTIGLLDTSIDHVPPIFIGVEVVLSRWKTNVVLLLCRFIEFFLNWPQANHGSLKIGLGPI
jgi:hypothetical protein